MKKKKIKKQKVNKTSKKSKLLATHVDSFVLKTSFIGLSVPKGKKSSKKLMQKWKNYKATDANVSKLDSVIENHVEKEVKAKLTNIPKFKAFRKAITIKTNNNVKGIESLNQHIQKSIKLNARKIYDETISKERKSIIGKLANQEKSILSSKNKLIALSKLSEKFSEKFGVFNDGFLNNFAQKTSKDNLSQIENFGLLFLERTRIRPVGHTIERAPFYQLSLEPGESVSLRQKSFTKRASSLEETFEESEERKSEYSSTFTTELSEELSNSFSRSSNWGISKTVSGTLGSPEVGFQQSNTGNYGASTTDTITNTEAARNTERQSRNVETTQKRLHKTVVSTSQENIYEEETIKTIRNNELRPKKILMRKVMQVLHLSYERYGTRLCWSPCIENPGKSIASISPESFPNEVAAIREKWDNATPPSDLTNSLPANRTVRSGVQGEFKGGIFGFSENRNVSIIVPSGYMYNSAIIEIVTSNGDPNVEFRNSPSANSTGSISFNVHIGLEGGGLGQEKVSFKIAASCTPDSNSLANYEASINNWRNEQIEIEINELLEKKKEEIQQNDPNIWIPSELMRRAVIENFGNIESLNNCELISEIHKIFEWENMSYRLHAPWWNPELPIDGFQSMRTSFNNASWAKLFIPIRPGYEEKGMRYLLSIGAIPNSPELLEDYEYYLIDYLTNLKPKYESAYVPDINDVREISGSLDLSLTEHNENDWRNEYERDEKFKVIKRWTVTIPTDGVDYETCFVDDASISPLTKATEDIEISKAKIQDAILQRVENGDGDLKINVGEND